MYSTPMNHSRPGSILPTPSISPNLSPFANPPKNHIDSDDEGIYKQEWININKQHHNSNFMSQSNVTKPASPPNTLRELETVSYFQIYIKFLESRITTKREFQFEIADILYARFCMRHYI